MQEQKKSVTDSVVFSLFKYTVLVACCCIVTYLAFVHKNPIMPIHNRIDSVGVEVGILRQNAHDIQRRLIIQHKRDSIEILALKNIVLLEKFRRQEFEARYDSLSKSRSPLAPGVFKLPQYND